KFVPEFLGKRLVLAHLPPPPFLLSPFGGRSARLERSVISHAVKPVAHGFPSGKRSRLANADQESPLESVLGIVRIAKNAPADAQHHGTVTPHQGLEGRLLTPGKKTLQKLPVRQAGAVALESNPAQVAKDLVHLACRHGKLLRGPGLARLYLYVPGRKGNRSEFWVFFTAHDLTLGRPPPANRRSRRPYPAC